MTLPSRAEIIVIGGGIIGCSTAYHLAKDHKADVLLIEQSQLTSGSTWHAAGLVGQLRSSASITRVLKYSVELYKRLEAETGLATGWKMTGCLRLATNQDRWTEYKRLTTTAKSFGMEMHLISPAEVKKMWPLMNTDDLVGASWLPTDGQASPSDITQALAKGARMAGARIVEGVTVTGFRKSGTRITHVVTSQGEIECDKVVNCAGQWARQIGAMAGINVPLQPVRHQYIITEEIQGLARDVPTLRDPDRRTYFKEEVGGLVMGGYEPNPQIWTQGDVPNDWNFRLFDDDWDHFGQHLDQAIARIPALETAGVKRMINGPESFTPDGMFILGVAPGCGNMFTGAGFNAFGIASGGGAGWVLADWVVRGEAPMDLWVADIRRFGAMHSDRQWVADRTAEAYGKHYTIGYPHEEYESGRPLLTSPLYARLKAMGGVFGSKLGWERPNWFGDVGSRDEVSMGRANWFDPVGEEHRLVREDVGVFDQTSFAKYEVRGKGAAEALDRIAAGDLLKPPGRLTYTQLLNSRGGIEADLTMARLSDDHFYIVTGTGFRTHDLGWLNDHLPPHLQAVDVTEDWGVLSLFGPRARDILAQVTTDEVSNAAFPFGHVRDITISGVKTRALRVSYTGELGWELHIPINGMEAVFDALQKHHVRPVGYRALESLRLEKGYRAWGSDITPNDTPYEAGLGFAVKLASGRDFIGRNALTKDVRKRFCGFTLPPETVLIGRETIIRNGEPVGYLTSGGFGYTVNQSIGYGYVRHSDIITKNWLEQGIYSLIVAIDEVQATLALAPFYDPEGISVKS